MRSLTLVSIEELQRRLACSTSPFPQVVSDVGEASAVADLNGDGLPDVVSVGYSSDVGTYLRSHLSDGSGNVVTAGTVAIDPRNSQGNGLALGDLDHDGDLDVLLATVYPFPGDGQHFYKSLNASGLFAAPIELSADDIGNLGSLGDLDGDGRVDRVNVVSSTATNSTVAVTWADANGNFPGDDTDGYAPSSGVSGLRIVDADDDGDLDIVTFGSRSNNTTSVAVFANNGGRSFTRTLVPIAGGTAAGLDLADVNGDGRADLFTIGSAGMVLRLSTTGGGYAAATSVPIVDAGGTAVATNTILVGDLDGDGLRDALVNGAYVIRQAPDHTFTLARPGERHRGLRVLGIVRPRP